MQTEIEKETGNYRESGSCLNILRGGFPWDKAKSMRPNRHFLLTEQESMSLASSSCPVSMHLKRPFSSSLKVGDPSRLPPSFSGFTSVVAIASAPQPPAKGGHEIPNIGAQTMSYICGPFSAQSYLNANLLLPFKNVETYWNRALKSVSSANAFVGTVRNMDWDKLSYNFIYVLRD